MAQLKDLIVTGPARIIGTLYAQNASTDVAGLVKLGGGTSTFLRADGTWATPAGTTTAATATPLVDGTAAVGTSAKYAREDHVHPTDTTRAPLASPALTGTPTAPTPGDSTNNTQIATTAFVKSVIGNSAYLPSYVDDVLEYDAKANFPTTGETGKIYIDKTTNLTWRWGGSAYVEISPSLAIGSTASTAAAGNHTHSFTPAGTISVQTAGTTNNTLKPVTAKTVVTGATFNTVVTGGSKTSIPNITKKTVVTSASGATAAYSSGTLTITDGSFGTGDSVTVGTAIEAYTSLTTGVSGSATTGDSVTLGTAVTVKTGDAAYKFTGTAGTTGVPA